MQGPPNPTPQYQLVQIRLGRDLAAHIGRARGQGLSWRTIAADLTAVTGVPISHETLRVWFAEDAVA